MNQALHESNHAYWMQRAAGYSLVNQEELEGIQHQTWAAFLTQEIEKRYPDVPREQIRILDIGAGPGFLSIILTEQGYQVTAADFAEEMLQQARLNAGELAGLIHYTRQDAMNLEFADHSYDVVLSRNLTWNLPDPERAYAEWLRVLKPDGLMLVFDANWYHYLHDDAVKLAYEQDRVNVAANDLGDYNIGENFDKMEVIADQMPMTRRMRPAWDQDCLSRMGISEVTALEDVGEFVYSEKEKINYTATPMFMVRAVKG